MTDLAKLIERVEKASGPDREIDEALTAFGEGAERVEDATFDHKHGYVRNGFWVSIGPIKPYTASVDAALALTERVLPGRSIFLAIDPHEQAVAQSCSCDIANGTRDPWTASAFTTPLAIILATLRALQARQQ